MPPKAPKKKFVPLAHAAAAAAAARVAEPTKAPPPAAAEAIGLAPHPAAVKAAEEARMRGNHGHRDDHCFICTDPISWYAVGECNHRVCHLCSLRLRALLKDNNCSMCKTALSDVIFTGDAEKPFTEFNLNRMAKVDRKLSIHFDTDQAYDDVMILLRFNCPDADCDVACPNGWPELKKHVRQTHNKHLCDLCTRHKKLFTHEHTMYTQSDLDKHFKSGDSNDLSFKGHPKCGFCNVHFYGDDELYEHCKKQHEQCFLCTGVGIRHQYYEDYNRLEQHFRKEHFCCMDPECLEKKFQVFFSDIDLKAHEMQVHPTKKTARGKGQKIDINFSIAGSPSLDLGSRTGSGSSAPGGNNRNRGRNNNRREEAPQRDMGDMSEQFGEPRYGSGIRPPPGFGQLTREAVEPTPAEATNIGGVSAASRTGSSANLVGIAGSRYANSVNQGFDRSDMNFPPPQRAATPIVAAASSASSVSKSSASSGMMDPAILAILQDLFQSDKTKLDELKSIAKMYRNDLTTCSEFLNFFIRLVFDGRANAPDAVKKDIFTKSGRVWKSLADSIPETESGELYPKVGQKSKKQSKQEEMLRVWNDYRVKNDMDYSNPYNESSYANPVQRSGSGNNFPPPAASSSRNNGRPQANSSPNQSARVLVIKSKASNQRNNTPMWNAMSKGKGFVSSLEDTNAKRPIFDTTSNSSRSSSVGPEFRDGLSSASASFSQPQPEEPTPSQIQAALLWSGNTTAATTVSSIGAKSKPATPAIVGGSQEFPGLPSRPVSVTPLPRKGSNINEWESGSSQGYEQQQQQQQQQPQQGGKKKKKEKIVLMSIGL